MWAKGYPIMTHFRIAAAAAVLGLALCGAARADAYLGSYTARISDSDKEASDGYPLSTAAQMVRQDRANWHKFGSGDPEDEDDPWFGSAQSRVRLESMLRASGAMSAGTRRAIVNGHPLIQVDVYRNSVHVELVR